MENSRAAEMASNLIKDYIEIIPDHLGSMEAPIAKMCARKAVEMILRSNPQFTPYGIEPVQGAMSWWNDVLIELNK